MSIRPKSGTALVLCAFWSGVFFGICERQGKREGCAFAELGVLESNGAPHFLKQEPGNIEPEAGAAARVAGIETTPGLLEFMKQELLILIRNAGARVRDGGFEEAATNAETDGDRPMLCELHGVADEVVYNLLYAVLVGIHEHVGLLGGGQDDGIAFVFGDGGGFRCYLAEHFLNVEILGLEHHLALFKARNIEEVVDDANEALAGVVDVPYHFVKVGVF